MSGNMSKCKNSNNISHFSMTLATAQLREP